MILVNNNIIFIRISVFLIYVYFIELPKRISERDANDMVFMSQFTLQLCDIAIGSPVIIATKDEVVVKTAWPTSEKSLTSVSLTKHGELACSLIF